MVLNFSNAKLSNLIIHFVGNKVEDSGYELSDLQTKNEDKESQSLLVNYFLSPFKDLEFYSFWHESDIKLNACYSFVLDIFENKKQFISKSKSIAKHLYECSTHPRIKPGELFIARLSGCILDDEVVDAIVIYKSETKDSFLQSHKEENHFELLTQYGASTSKIDKGCIIFNCNQKDGYKICVIDNLSRGSEAAYWKDDFLKVTTYNDEYQSTKQILALTKTYITKQFTEDFEVSKSEQIDLLNRSIEYFKSHESFDKKEFEKEVFYHQETIKSFRNFDIEYRQNNEIEIDDSFEISPLAVKKQVRFFKNVIKLDKNFDIYIHGSRDMIEQGFDEKTGKRFYKIYFDHET